MTKLQRLWWGVKASVKAWSRIWLNPVRWTRFWVQRGSAAWCGRFVIVHAPVNVSVVFGRGTQGLWLYRWRERGHDTIRMG